MNSTKLPLGERAASAGGTGVLVLGLGACVAIGGVLSVAELVKRAAFRVAEVAGPRLVGPS